MKTKKIIAMIISVVMLLSCFVVSAASFSQEDSEVWTKLTDKQANDLLKNKKESFIFVFYRDNCPNSQYSIPNLLKYAEKNDMSLCGLNANDYPTWMTWAELGRTSIGFPYIIAYNAAEKLLADQDNVMSVKEFEDLLGKVNMLPGSDALPGKTSNAPFFEDVEAGSTYYNAIRQLSSDGILNGYEDGTFKPENSISRAEAAAVIVRATGLTTDKTVRSIYTDVAEDFWGKEYIMAANKAGIISGMGDGSFAPQNKLTNVQIIKMIVCMLGLEQAANENGGWPDGYVEVAKEKNIIDLMTYYELKDVNYKNAPSTRGQVALWVYNARRINGGTDFKVSGKTYKLGMDATELGFSDEVWPSVYGFSWHIYGTKNYKNFLAAGVADGKVVALASVGVGFEYKGYKAGQNLNDASENNGEFLLDKNDKNIIHGVLLVDRAYNTSKQFSAAALLGESKMNFHCTNAFRVYHKLSAYEWDDNAAEAARLHSVDMASNGYFDHTGLDGSNMGTRMRAQGVNWTSCAENIAAGNALGILAYDAWVNSSGHRKNMLGGCTHLGVGFAYNEKDTYKFYSTQNFYAHASAFDTFFN